MSIHVNGKMKLKNILLSLATVAALDGARAPRAQLGRWLHDPQDAHQTVAGKEVIASTIFKAGLLHAMQVEGK